MSHIRLITGYMDCGLSMHGLNNAIYLILAPTKVTYVCVNHLYLLNKYQGTQHPFSARYLSAKVNRSCE
jgi:hypothetical protein